MRRKVLTSVLATAVLGTGLYANSQGGRVFSWTTTKSHLRTAVMNTPNPRTLYAGCLILEGYIVDYRSCNFYYRRANGKADQYGRPDAEHIVPSSRMMGFTGCGTYSRADCRKFNSRFKRCHNDLDNLFPSISTINRFRGKLPFVEIPDNLSWYPFGKGIGFKKSLDGRYVEPPEGVKPLVGSTYLLMEGKGCVGLSEYERGIYTTWARLGPK